MYADSIKSKSKLLQIPEKSLKSDMLASGNFWSNKLD